MHMNQNIALEPARWFSQQLSFLPELIAESYMVEGENLFLQVIL